MRWRLVTPAGSGPSPVGSRVCPFGGFSGRRWPAQLAPGVPGGQPPGRLWGGTFQSSPSERQTAPGSMPLGGGGAMGPRGLPRAAMTQRTICTSISKASIISTGGRAAARRRPGPLPACWRVDQTVRAPASIISTGGRAAATPDGVLEVEPDREGAGQEHGQDGPAAAAAQDPGQDGGQLGDDERTVEQEGPQAGEAVAVEAGVAGVGVQGAIAGREGDRGDPEGEGGDHDDDGPPERVEVREAQAHVDLPFDVEARAREGASASALGRVVEGDRSGWSVLASAWRQRSANQPTAPVTARTALVTARITLAATRSTHGRSWLASALAVAACLALPLAARVVGGWLPAVVRASRAARRATAVYSAAARARRLGPALRWMLSSTTTRAARAMVSRPRWDRPGSWPVT